MPGEGSGMGNGDDGEAGRLFWKLRSVILSFPKESQRELSMCYFHFSCYYC